MIAECVVRLGCEPVSIPDENRRLPDLDQLLVVGDGRKLPRLMKRLETARHRPRTVLWHMEPVLPPGITREAEALAARVARCDWDRLSAPWQRFGKAMLPARTQVQYARRAWCARGVRRQMRHDGRTDFDDLDANSLYFAAAQYAWIEQMAGRKVFDQIYTSSLPRHQFLESREIATTFVPIGFHSGWATERERRRTEDVVFLGRKRRTRRQHILGDLSRQLADRGVGLRVVDRNCFGRDRAELLCRAKILLTLVKFPWDHSGIRLMMGAACGTMVVSGPRGNAAPFRAGEHFVQAELDQLAERIAFYIAEDAERLRIVDNLRQFAGEQWSLERSISQVLDLAVAPSAAELQIV